MTASLHFLSSVRYRSLIVGVSSQCSRSMLSRKSLASLLLASITSTSTALLSTSTKKCQNKEIASVMHLEEPCKCNYPRTGERHASACRYVATSLRSPVTPDKNVHPAESHCTGGLTPHRSPNAITGTFCFSIRVRCSFSFSLIQFSRLDCFQPIIVNCCAFGLIRRELSCCPVRTVNHGNHVGLAWM